MEHSNQIEIVESNIRALFKIYEPRFSPPEWILNPDTLQKVIKCFPFTTIYFDSSDNTSTTLANVKKLVAIREPTNISNRSYYSKNDLMASFGYHSSIYGSLPDSINIAAFTKTLFRPAGENASAGISHHQNNYYVQSTDIFINLLNVCAPAFDSNDQPDFKYFSRNDRKDIWALQKRFALIFKMIFECALRKNMKHIMLIGFGLGAFGNAIDDYIAGLNMAYKKYINRLESNNIKLYYCDFHRQGFDTIMGSIDINLEYLYVSYDSLWDFVDNVNTKYDIYQVLFVNAWDPHSILGNGNFSDNSWDGHFGRRTAISVLALPQLNPCIEYIDLCN